MKKPLPAYFSNMDTFLVPFSATFHSWDAGTEGHRTFPLV